MLCVMKTQPRSSGHHLSCQHFSRFSLLCLDFLGNLHLSLCPGSWEGTCSLSISRVSSNVPGVLTMIQCDGQKASCSCGPIKFVRPLWFIVSEAFRELFWGVSLGRSVGSRKRRRKRRPYSEHKNFPGFVNPHSSICIYL